MQERIDSDKLTARYWFDSLAELVRYIDNTPKTWGEASSSTRNEATAKWDLKAGYNGALDMAREGWIDGAKQTQEALKVFTPATPALATRNDFYGHMPHVPRFCAGAPDNMVRHVRNPNSGAGTVLTIVITVNAIASTDARCMRNFGLAIAQYVNQMETNGTRCEVIGAITSAVSGWRVTHAWRVKSVDQPLDLAVLAFAVGHPAMFRRLGFALRERCAAPQDYAYGQSIDTRVKDVINIASGAVILNGMKDANTHAPSPKAALGYVTRQIDRAIQDRDAKPCE